MSILATPYIKLQLILIALDIIKKDPGSRWRKTNPDLDFFAEIKKYNKTYKYNINKHSGRELKHKNNKELS